MENPKKEIISMIVYLAFIFIAVYLIITFVGQRTAVNGDSMEPTLSNGDNLIMDKLTYHFRDPQRFEVIIFPCPTNPEVFYIKRVVGLPGETIQIKDGRVYIDGEVLESDIYGITDKTEPGIAHEPIEIGEGEYFVLGDNRPISRDSRYADVALISRDVIEGRAFFRMYPFDQMGLVH